MRLLSTRIATLATVAVSRMRIISWALGGDPAGLPPRPADVVTKDGPAPPGSRGGLVTPATAPPGVSDGWAVRAGDSPAGPTAELGEGLARFDGIGLELAGGWVDAADEGAGVRLGAGVAEGSGGGVTAGVAVGVAGDAVGTPAVGRSVARDGVGVGPNVGLAVGSAVGLAV